MQIRFAHKLLLVILIPLIVGQLGTLFGVMRVAENEVRDTAREDLRIGANVINHYLESRTEERHQTVEVLAADYALKEVLAFSDSESIRSALENHGQRLEADFAAFIWAEDAQPIVTRFAQQNGLSQFVSSSTYVELDPPSVSSVVLESGVYQLFSAPVKAPTTIGHLVFGFHVGNNVVQRMEELTGLEVGLFRSDVDGFKDVTSSGRVGESWIDATSGLSTVFSVQDGDQTHLGIYTQLSAQDQHVVVALRKSLAVAMAPYIAARYTLLLFGLGVLCLVGLIGLWLSRSVARPVADLSQAVEQVAQGSYTAELTLSRNDEFGRLADTFRSMQSAIAERENKILHQSHHDDLSGLPNRIQLMKSLRGELSRRSTTAMTLIAIRIGGMQTISSSIGQSATDQLIVHLTQLIQVRMPPGGVLYHTGTHELFMVLPEQEIRLASELARKAANQISKGVLSGQQNIRIHTCWGISRYPDHGADATDLVRFAQVAATDAYARQETVEIYETDREQIFERQLKIVNDLPGAIESHELTVVYQPKVNLADGSINGAEALVRWTHGELGFLPPDEFIPLAEQSGTILLVTRFVITEAVQKLSELHNRGYAVRMGINLSTRDLLDEGLADFVINVLGAYGMQPEHLILEVTETSIMEHVDRAVSTLERLRELGITLAIDDFGTGQSSLAQLQKLPIDELKVDKGFVMPLATDTTSDLLVSTTIALAHQMGLKVVAEGVEDEYSARRLSSFGCEIGQGYFFAKPLSFDELVDWLASYEPVSYPERRGRNRPFAVERAGQSQSDQLDGSLREDPSAKRS